MKEREPRLGTNIEMNAKRNEKMKEDFALIFSEHNVFTNHILLNLTFLL